MRKRLIGVVFSIIFIGLLSGCGQDYISNKSNKVPNRFVDTGDSYNLDTTYEIYYDRKTHIVYLIANRDARQTGITCLYNKDGRPMTYAEYIKTR